MIEKVKYRVNRDSPEDKTRDFLKWMEATKEEINHLVSVATITYNYVICFVQIVLRDHWYTNMFVYNM